MGDPNLNKKLGKLINGILSKFIFDNVVDFDLSSLYPSIILAFNIDATTQYGKVNFSEDSKFKSEDLFDDLVSKDYINIGCKYFNMPNVSEMLDIVDRKTNKTTKKAA